VAVNPARRHRRRCADIPIIPAVGAGSCCTLREVNREEYTSAHISTQLRYQYDPERLRYTEAAAGAGARKPEHDCGVSAIQR